MMIRHILVKQVNMIIESGTFLEISNCRHELISAYLKFAFSFNIWFFSTYATIIAIFEIMGGGLN